MSTHTPSRLAVAALAAVAAAFLAVPVEAQYFGRNKVQYEDLDFRVLETENFDVYHYDEERDASVMAARMTERWYARLSRALDHDLTGRQPLILYANHPDFRQTTAIPGQIGEATGGVTEPLKRRIVLPMAGPLAETDHVLGHELVHAFQYDMTGIDPNNALVGAPAISRVPLWLVEGMAEYMSVGSSSALTAMWMRDALVRDRELPTVGDLRNPRKYFPYRYGHAFWSFVAGTFGDQAVKEVFRQAARSTPSQALRRVTGVSADTLSFAWHEALRDAYGPVLEETSPPSEFGEAFVTEETVGGGTNVAPSISPDGDRVVFLSERSRFAMEMYLADAETGEVIRQLTETAVDPHFQSLQFINSAGAWAPDGRRFAFAAVVAGDPVLSIIDVTTGERIRSLEYPRFGEIFNPTWGPNGERVAFVANDGGTLDLFVAEVASGEVRRLTDDPWAELHPSWSPDGDRIAFATDRFRGNLDRLHFRSYGLAAVDPRSGEVERLPSFEDARNTNPQWGPDGENVYFISDRGGIPNLYRADLASGEAVALTDVNTGVSGITELSPALTVAREDGRIVYGAYREGNYELYRTDAPEPVAAAEAPAPASRQAVVTLPPTRREGAVIDDLLADVELGLPSPVTFRTHDYDPSLSLDYVSQPTLGAAASSSGFFVGGGASLYFSDMLGYHSLSSLVQLSILDGEVLNGIGALGSYVNRDDRLNWGVTVGQVPEITQSFRTGFADPDGDGETEIVRNTFRFWKVNRRAVASVAYPFSTGTRVEFGAGFERIDYELKVQRDVFSLRGARLDERSIEAPPCGGDLDFQEGDFCEPGALNQGVATAALVRDVSVMGPTGPVMGQRFRLEASPSFGTLNYLTALGDFRQYSMPFEPVTLAGRALHLGRYGSGSEDERISQLFIGYPSLVRGYDSGSFDFRGCTVSPSGNVVDCPQLDLFNELIGSRMAVANAEVRVPLLGPLGLLTRSSGVPPIDLFGFFDAGVAWTAAEEASFLGGSRDIVKSAGVGLRTNLFGFAMAQLYWARPFDREDEDSTISFSLTPAF